MIKKLTNDCETHRLHSLRENFQAFKESKWKFWNVAKILRFLFKWYET